MEAPQSPAAGTCPSWCITDHSALLIDGEPKHGKRAAHVGIISSSDSMYVLLVHNPGQEPRICIDNLLDGLQLAVSAAEAESFLSLVRWLAGERSSTVRRFASAVGKAVEEAGLGQDPSDAPDGGGGR